MSFQKTLHLTKTQQLVDLNGDITNFDLNFNVLSKNNLPFYMLVVDQNTLDNNANLDYKNIEKTISGNIISDKNLYQNYFLCLKSEQGAEVQVTVEIKEIPPKPETPETSKNINENQNMKQPTPDFEQQSTNLNKKIFITIAIIAILCLIYYLYINFWKNKNNRVIEPATTIPSNSDWNERFNNLLN